MSIPALVLEWLKGQRKEAYENARDPAICGDERERWAIHQQVYSHIIQRLEELKGLDS